MATAQTADFFGGGTIAAPNVQAPHDPNDDPNPANPGGISNNELLRRQQIQASPQAAYQDLQRQQSAPVDQFGNPYSTLSPGTPTGQTLRDSNGNLVQIVADSSQQRDANNAKLGTVSGPASNPSFTPPATASALGSEPYQNNPIVQNGQNTADALASNVQNTQPTTNPATDPTKANMQALTPVVDPSLATSPETDRALAQSQDLVNRVLNTPLQSQILGDQALSNQLAQARSARGGAGAVQNAEDAARNAAPALLQQAAQSSTQEQVARAGAAGQAASIYAGVATNDANRAANIATANQTAGVQVLNNLTTLTGQQLNFDANKMQAIGQLARDYFANSQAFAQMDVQTQIAQWNNLTQKYGIDTNAKTAIEAVAASKKIGPLDALKVVLGIGQSAAGLAAL